MPLSSATTAGAAAPPALFGLLAEVAAVSTPEEADASIPHVVERLAEACGAAACQLDTAGGRPGAEQLELHTVSRAGYATEVGHHLSTAFARSAFGQQVVDTTLCKRVDEWPYEFRDSTHFLDVLHPAGYDDGISLALRDNGSQVVGMVHLSAARSRDFVPGITGALPVLGPALARLTQVAGRAASEPSLPADYAVTRLDAAGRATPVVGRPALHLLLDEELLGIVRGVLRTGTRFATFLHQQAGNLVEVRVHAPAGRASAHQPCTVATRPAASTLGLTTRQLEVLTAVATGASNREIAEELCLTQRTVAAHVEAILVRLGTPSRAGAAAKATAAGMLLPRADPTSVRSLVPVLRRPSA